MRKQNILDLLCDDFIDTYNMEEENLKNTINSYEEYDKDIISYILPYLNKTYKIYELDFDYNINSSDEITKYKSLALTSSIIYGVCDLIKSMPTYFNTYKQEYGIQQAYEEICFRVLVGNILQIKKGLKNIEFKKDLKEKLDNVYNILQEKGVDSNEF